MSAWNVSTIEVRAWQVASIYLLVFQRAFAWRRIMRNHGWFTCVEMDQQRCQVTQNNQPSKKSKHKEETQDEKLSSNEGGRRMHFDRTSIMRSENRVASCNDIEENGYRMRRSM